MSDHQSFTPDESAATAHGNDAVFNGAKVKERLRSRLEAAEAEHHPAKILIENFRAQWRWLGIEDDQPVELQQLEPKTPDEDRAAVLRAKHRDNAAAGEYRPANRYARAFGLRSALRLLAHASDNFQHQGLYLIANSLKRAVADKAKVDTWNTFAKGSGTTDQDIARRNALMLDLDPRRDEGVKDVSATEHERAHSIERALDLYCASAEFLGDERSLAFVSSGNGAQIKVRVDLPNTPEVTLLVKRLLLVLDQLYSTDEVELDTAVFDAKRLFPACGTYKRKGANNPATGRIHRQSLFIAGSDEPRVLTLDEVRALLAAFEARLNGEQRTSVERALGATGAASPASTTRQPAGDSDLSKANDVPVSEVARKLGLDPVHPVCPFCGAESGVDILERKGINALKCLHATCNARTAWPVDLVAKIAFGCEQLKGSKGITPRVLEWFAENFGLDVRRRSKTTTPSKEVRAATFKTLMAKLDGTVSSAPPQTEERTCKPAAEAVPCRTGPEGESATTDEDIDGILQGASALDAVQQEKVLDGLRSKLGIGKTALRKRLAELTHEAKDDGEDADEGGDALGALLEEVDLVEATTCRLFAVVDGEVIPVDSARLKTKLAYLYNRATGRRLSPSTIETALAPLLGGHVRRGVVPVRSAYGSDGSIWIDLGTTPARYVHITKTGVRTVDDAPVRFYRPPMMGALPEPVFPKDDTDCAKVFEEARAHFQIDRQQLTSAFIWAVGALRPGEPHGGGKLTDYLIMLVTGAPGAGKTTFADSWSETVDPKAVPHFKLPKDDQALAILAENTRTTVFNNLSHIPQWTSDALCELADGGGMALRALFTNRDATVFKGSNAVALVSIKDVAVAPDLLDRTLTITLPERSEYIEPEVVDAMFYALRPRLLGALLYCASRALRDSANMKAPKGVRMAGAARWALAAAPAGGFAADEIAAAFTGAIREADQQVLDQPLAKALAIVVKPGETWSGETGDLLAQLTAAHEARIPETGTPTKRLPKRWPETPRGLASILRTLAKTLTRSGFTFVWPTAGGRLGRILTVTRAATVGEIVDSDPATGAVPASVQAPQADLDFDEIMSRLDTSEERLGTVGTISSTEAGDRSAVKNRHGNDRNGRNDLFQEVEKEEKEEPREQEEPPEFLFSERIDETPKEIVPIVPPFPSLETGPAEGTIASATIVPPKEDIVPGTAVRARAVRAWWEPAQVACDDRLADRLTVEIQTEVDTSPEPETFDYRVGDWTRLEEILVGYGWTGGRTEDGAFVGFDQEVYITTREHVFADGTRARIVTDVLRAVTAQAS